MSLKIFNTPKINNDLYHCIPEGFNRIRLWLLNALLKLNLSQDILSIIMAVLVGLGAGYGAVVFHDGIELVHQLLFYKFPALFPQGGYTKYLIILFPVLGGLAVGIVAHVAPKEAIGHGVPDVIKAVIARAGFLRPVIAFWTMIVSAFSIGSGGGAGREGPIIQIGASIGSAVGQFFKISTDQLRVLVAAGGAAGVAAIFNAPIGGVMFALEVLIGDFSVRKFTPIVIASVVATAVSRSILGNHPTFVQTHYTLVSNSELFFYLLLGMLSGVMSVGFVKTLFAVEEVFKQFRRIPKFLMPAFGGLGVGILLFFFPSLAGFSYDLNNQAILGKADVLVLFAVMLLKPVAAGLTLGSGGSGGVFAPSLKAGAAFGGLIGFILHWAFPESTASMGAYALVAMGAFLAGTMHAPLTAILVIFEVADTYQVILPIMFASIASAVVARMFMKRSVYTAPLERDGIEIGYGINVSIVHRVPIDTLIDRNAVAVQRQTTIHELFILFEQNDQPIFPVVGDKNHLIGIVRLQDCRSLISNPLLQNTLVVQDVMMKNFPSLKEKDTLDTVMKTFELADTETLPVINDTQEKKFIGTIGIDAALRRYRRGIMMQTER